MQEDEDYESGSENFYIPTPLSTAPRVYHVSTVDDLSFNLAYFGQSPTPPEQHAELSPNRYRFHNLTCCCLVFTSSNDGSLVRCSEKCNPPSSANPRSSTSREADISTSVHHDLCQHITFTSDPFLNEAGDDVSSSFYEHFPTMPLDDDI